MLHVQLLLHFLVTIQLLCAPSSKSHSAHSCECGILLVIHCLILPTCSWLDRHGQRVGRRKLPGASAALDTWTPRFVACVIAVPAKAPNGHQCVQARRLTHGHVTWHWPRVSWQFLQFQRSVPECEASSCEWTLLAP